MVMHKEKWKKFRRERRLFMLLLVLAPLIEGMFFLAYYQQSHLPSQVAKLGGLSACRRELSQCTAAYLRDHHHYSAEKGI